MLPSTNLTTTLIGNELGVSSRNVRELCTSSSINKWSKWKPIRSSKTTGIVKADIISAKAGLVASQELTILRGACFPNGVSTPTSKTLSEVEVQIKEYSYSQPRGTSYSERYRIGDFRDYNSATTPPNNSAEDTSTQLGTFEQYVNQGQTTQNDPSNIYNWAITSPPLFLFSNVGIKLGEGSNENVGFVGSSDAIPLPWIFANAGTCRLGIAVRLPKGATSYAAGNWALFVGQRTLDSSNAAGTMLPSISTNMRMYKELVTMSTDRINTYDCVPVLVENLMLDLFSPPEAGGKYLQTQATITDSTRIYPMPSGAKGFKFTIDKGDIDPSIPGADIAYTEKGWSLATIYTGQEVPSGSGSGKVPINLLALVRPAASPLTQTVTITLRTGVLVNNVMSYTDIYNQEHVINAGSTFSSNGKSFFGKSLNSGPGLTIYGYQGIKDNFNISVK